MTPEIQTPWLNARLAAAYIGRRGRFSFKWISRLAKERKIRAGHDGKRFLFRTEDLDAWMFTNAKGVRQ